MSRARHLMIDRIFKGVGRLHRSLETTDRREASRRERMLQTLSDQARLDILRGVQAGRLSVAQVAEAFKANRLERLPTAEAMLPLIASVEDWLASGQGSRKPLSEATLASYRSMWQQALRIGVFGSSPTVADVNEARVEAYRNKLWKDGHAPMANRFWAAAKSFLGQTLGRRHPQVLALQDLRRYPELKHPRPALTPGSFWDWHDHTHEAARPALLALGITGMMPSELERLTPEHFDRPSSWLLIPGQKTEGRPRIVGVPSWGWSSIEAVTPWTMDRSRWQKLIIKSAKAAKVPWARLYDLRRAFAQWHQASGTPESRIKAYMGHSTLSMTGGYLRAEVQPYALEDAERMGNYMRGHQQTLLRIAR